MRSLTTSLSSRPVPPSPIPPPRPDLPRQDSRYLLDGEPVTLAELVEANDFSAEDVAEIIALPPGQSMHLGGGAAPLFTLTRVASKLRVTLMAEPNRDFPTGTSERELRIPPQQVEVADLAAARSLVRSFIESNHLGGGNWTGQAGRVTLDGVPYCRVSYNGRFWRLDEHGRELCVEIDEKGAAR